MHIVSSTLTEGAAQTDGRFYVSELHTVDDGQEFKFEYLSDGVDTGAVLQARALELNTLLEQKAAAKALVLGTTLPITVYEFLSRMTPQERVGIRATAKTNPIVEDFMDLLNRSGAVYPNNQDVQMGLQYLVAIGGLTAGRAAIIGVA